MDRVNRTAPPVYMTTNYKRWGRQFARLKERNPAAQFQWYVYNGDRVNTLILPLLQAMTDYHCAFCDVKGLEEGVQEPTIEHFRPSSRYPYLSHYWYNLFPCCYSCQRKGNDFDKALLKPDRDNYGFDDYFLIDWETGKLLERYAAPDPRYFNAKKTIELYGLNLTGRKKARLQELKTYNNDPAPNINDYSYRFFIARA